MTHQRFPSLPRRALLLAGLTLCALAATPSRAADTTPDLIYLAQLELASGKVSGLRAISTGLGNSFQPSFTLDGGAVLFVAASSETAQQIYRHDIAKASTAVLTRSPDKLYSPTPLPDGSGFSVVRVVTPDPFYGAEANEPPVWRYGWDGQPIEAAVSTRRVGYHAWIDEQQLALFVVDEQPERQAHSAVLVNRRTGARTVLTHKPGRAFSRTPDGRRASFIDQSDPAHAFIMTMGADDAQPQTLVETPAGSGYFVWLPDGSILMAQGHALLRWNGQAGSAFTPFASLPELNGSIRNIAASPDGRRLAFSVRSRAVP